MGKRVKGVISLMISLLMIVSLLNVPTLKVQAANVEINYAKLLQESLYFYDANMCGDKVSERSAFSWRSNCHSGDKKVTVNGKTVDISGGFHDAGDHLKAGLPQAYAASILGVAYYEYKQAFEDTKSTAHLQTITNHFCEYFEKCTVLKSDGSVEAFVYEVSTGDEDHKQWTAPENQNAARSIFYTSNSNTATDIVSETAAALTLQYLNFKDSTALSYAKKLFEYARSHDKMVARDGLWDSSTGDYIYDSTSWGDDYAFAAALLYKATGDTKYKSEFDSIKNNGSGGYNIWAWFSWDNVSALAYYYGTGDAYSLSECANNMKSGMDTAGGYGCLLQWGSARYNCNTQFLGLLCDKAKGSKNWADWSTGQMKYLMGNNNKNQCYIVGYNNYSAKYPHHRAASASGDASQISDKRHVLLGALVGGPKNSNGDYTDSQSDYQCNEVALDYNAGLVGAAAALYTIHKNDGTSTNTLLTENNIKEAGAELRFYYDSQGKKKTIGGGSNPNDKEIFTDVRDSSKFYYNSVYWAYSKGITTGTTKTTFSPYNNCTRAQIVTFLWRLKGSPEPKKIANFSDMEKGAYYVKAVSWAAENGITTGLNDKENRFGVDLPCTRAMCVTFLWRAANKPTGYPSSGFVDVESGKYYYDAVNWAVKLGITKGVDSKHFGTDETCSRAMIVTFLYRYANPQ